MRKRKKTPTICRGLGLDGFNAISFLKREVIDKENLQEYKYLQFRKKLDYTINNSPFLLHFILTSSFGLILRFRISSLKKSSQRF